MSGSFHIRSVLIGVEYRNWRQTLDVYLLFAILLGKIKSKINYSIHYRLQVEANSKKIAQKNECYF